MFKKLIIAGMMLMITIPGFSQDSSKKTVKEKLEKEKEEQIIKEKVIANSKKLENFYKKSMADSVAGLFSSNCHIIREYGEIIESRDLVEDTFKKEFKSDKVISGCKFEPLEIKVYDEIVLEIGVNTISYSRPPDKKLYVEKYNYMFVWKESKSGKYQIRSAMWNLPKKPGS